MKLSTPAKLVLWEEEEQRSGEDLRRSRKRNSEVCDDEGQAKKSTWRMPWHQEPMKDVISCEKLREGANDYRSADFRMGKPGKAILCQHILNK